ncbi:MAG: aminotransferase class V-fold PLP-dependent enzyme [Roseovarius sp.]|nr:aminotransferase class V-fold PLP-dependent enzyme [Roseovarius sp.]
MTRVYLDYNASAPLRPEASESMMRAMDFLGNPSSVHKEGRAVKALVEKARRQVAAGVGCKPAEVVFTSGATESARVLAGRRVSVENIAHDAIWNYHCGETGSVEVVAIGLANSETGVISHPARTDELLLLDITQALGRMPFSFEASGADMAICSAHKLGGPKGVGALIVREGLDVTPLSTGGGQEMGRRSGTENVIGIAGFGAAIAAAMEDMKNGLWSEVEKIRNILELSIENFAKDTIFIGRTGPRLPNTSCFITPGWRGETQVMAMDLAGYAISAGSACSSGKVKTSRVLKSIGYSESDASCAVRVSLGPGTTEKEVCGFAYAWMKEYKKIKARRA